MIQIIEFLPILVLVLFFGALFGRKHLKNKKWDIPFRDDHERAPGESLRIKLEEMDDDLAENGILLLVLSVIPIVLVSIKVPHTTAIAVTATIGAFQVFHCWKLWKLIPTISDYRVGFDGERLTAQYLQPLLCQGYHVYHDIPMKDYNVDHVVVGPNGVFAIETKARRKRRSAGAERARVKYDGKTLQYPEQPPETWGIEAARDRAKGLQQWLSSAIGEPVIVQPILSLPGWYVERTGARTLPVMNPKSIPSFVGKYGSGRLSETQVKRIRHQLGARGSEGASRD